MADQNCCCCCCK